MDTVTGPGWAVAGYAVDELVGRGRRGEVWRGRDLATGAAVALRRLVLPVDPIGRDRLRRDAARLAAFDHPHLVGLQRVAAQPDGVVLVLDFAAGGSLAELVAGRPTLAPGEVVTVVAPLAGAMAEAHARGLVHGELSVGNVLFTADGRPLLADLGLARLVGDVAGGDFWPPAPPAVADAAAPPGPVVTAPVPTPSDDVRALAALAARLLGELELAPPALAAAVRVGLGGGPEVGRAQPDGVSRLPTAAEFAAAVRAAHPPSAVRLPATTRVPARPNAAAAEAPAGRPVQGPAGGAPRSPRAADRPATGRTGAGKGRDRPVDRPRVPARAAPATRRRPPKLILFAPVLLVLAAVVGWGWARADGPATAGRLAIPAIDHAAPSSATASSAVGRPAAAGSPPATSRGRPAPTAAARSAAPAVAPAATAPADWRAVVAALVARRDAAFVTTDPAQLAAVYAPGAPAYASDAAALRDLRAAGVHARGLRHDVRSVEPVDGADGRLTLAIVDVLPAYDLLGADGALVAHRPGRGPQRSTLVLARASAGWRIAELTPG